MDNRQKVLRSLKGQRTKVFKKIEEEISTAQSLIQDAAYSQEVSAADQDKMEVSATVLSKFQERFDSLSDQILQNSEDRSEEEIDEDGDLITDVMARITRTLAELSIKSFQKVQPVRLSEEESRVPDGLEAIQQKIDKLLELQGLQVGVPSMSSTMLSDPASSQRTHSVRLPKIDLEKISGDILRFQEFWDIFAAAIHENSCLGPVEKLNYLRSFLSGEAKQVISGITTCDANYEVAVDLIKKRFGNEQASVDAHYSRLMDLSPAQNCTGKLRLLTDEIEKHLRCLSALGEHTEHSHFISLIMSKLPREVVIRLEEGKDDSEVWSVALLRKGLHSQLSARESAERQQTSTRQCSSRFVSKSESSSDRRFKPSFSGFGNRGPHPSTMEGLVAGERSAGTRRQTNCCAFCSGNHFSDECRKYRTIEERRRCLRDRCYVCLGNSHKSKECRSVKPCFHCGQVKKHNRSLYPTKFSRNTEMSAVIAERFTEEVSVMKMPSSSSNPESTHHAMLASGDRVLLQTAVVKVQNMERHTTTVSTRVLLDCGSNRSYISSSLAKRLELSPVAEESFSVVTFGSEKPKTINTSVAKVKLLEKNGSIRVLDVNVVPKITGDIHRVPLKFDNSSFLWKDLPLADNLPTASQSSSIDFLIGNDYYLEVVTSEKIQIGPGLYLLGSKLGRLLTGRVYGDKDYNPRVSMLVGPVSNRSIQQISPLHRIDPCLPIKPSFEDFWNLESIGIMDDPVTSEEDRALNQFNSTVKMSNGRYEVAWPWKESSPDLLENYELSLGRFKSLLRKFQSNPVLQRKYAEIIADQEAKGVIKQVTVKPNDGKLKHYIPHHPVVNMCKATTKVRIVYDASAKIRKTANSLNECLLKGPSFLENLGGILVRFRNHPIVLTSDIEKAFLQISLQQPDRDVTRFFWLKDPSTATSVNNIQLYRFCRVPFGIVSSPFLLAATVKYHLQQSRSPVTEAIHNNIYVDNVITGIDSTSQAVQFYKEAKQLFKAASMNLREWNSNSSELLSSIPKEDQISEEDTKVLGLCWNRNSDMMKINTQPEAKIIAASTKREILQALSSVFDPLGLFAPITVKVKILIRELWTHQLQWDDPIPPEYQKRWHPIATDLARIKDHQIPRFVGIGEKASVTYDLFCFCDASAKAYSAAVYLKVSSDKVSQVNLVFAKTRLCPSRKVSIPRSELLAVLIGSRAMEYISKELRVIVKKKVLWSYAQCVLHWLTSQKPQPVFIRKRIEEIRKHADISFRYVNTAENPADLATRCHTSYEELKSTFWWKGPSWLSKGTEEWSSWDHNILAFTARDEHSPDPPESQVKEATLPSASNLTNPYGMDLKRFSSLTKLYRVTAWSTRFINRCRGIQYADAHLSAEEINDARIRWDRAVQKTVYSEIQTAIDNGRRCNLKEQLKVQRDDYGIMRCHGRFLKSDLPDEIKYPKLLPRQHPYTTLIIRSYHERLLHAGVNHTLTQIRLDYWIPRRRAAVRQYLSKCVTSGD